MLVVVNRIQLTEPLEDSVFEQAETELAPRSAEIDGLQAFYLLRVSRLELVLLILADTEQAIEEMRDRIGDEWMRTHVVPRAAAAPERVVGEVVAKFERG